MSRRGERRKEGRKAGGKEGEKAERKKESERGREPMETSAQIPLFQFPQDGLTEVLSRGKSQAFNHSVAPALTDGDGDQAGP